MTTCAVLLPDFINMDVGPRCGKPAVKRLPGPLDFPVCAEHAEMFSPGAPGCPGCGSTIRGIHKWPPREACRPVGNGGSDG